MRLQTIPKLIVLAVPWIERCAVSYRELRCQLRCSGQLLEARPKVNESVRPVEERKSQHEQAQIRSSHAHELALAKALIPLMLRR